ncbi:MAG: adenosylmethionine--8-amino-7-oxononanoate transaminase [Methylomonas sp.]|nr:adenosylmethionine--8-amino-7-oxononanoate transaminase [Methylomonas sp.]PPD21915.1 MAG: adenosylmethionine--8-amino-7-oxononanoate transaminase [Methylomonas sp.]PPD25112.1 MAG: adenosylmethionine--8-amino-7-oxononanoate transaminase [Methylomonas sp.]PPD34607.1 MAG: adenosylmethionine--8-amino-7-oxononanoate transaminase [Methylomonas sp.]PPD40613.1 MAG: adenosylmethionine--8-amino-7-oxononanoate transaminase [Methylomonas sp.]
MTNNQRLTERDLAVLWHPCTQMKDHEQLPLIPIKSGQGVWLEDFDGNRYLDAISSWWVNLFGHANPIINQAVKRQLDTLEHVILGGFTHEAAVELAEKLVEITPPGLNKCFYADNGSSAVEIALKMSFHYWRNLGKTQKNRFITLENSYHGETLGALAVGNVALYKDTYGPLLMDVITVPGPDCYLREEGESWEAYSIRRFADMEQALARHADTVCAVIVEPLVQCAGNMRMYHPVYLRLLREACDRYAVHLIADEIAVGFGRTGTLFACEQAAISPDFLCLSKGLTGGYLPLSAVLTTDAVYQAFYDDYQNLTAFLHSHSYTGNALGCRAALATLGIFQSQDVLGSNRNLAAAMARAVDRFRDHPNVAEVRQTGMIVAIELVKHKAGREPFPWQERRGLRVYRHGLSQGVLLRPLGNVIYFMPPYVITEQEIERMVAVAWQGIQQAVQD